MTTEKKYKRNFRQFVITGFVLICFLLLISDVIINFRKMGKTHNGDSSMIIRLIAENPSELQSDKNSRFSNDGSEPIRLEKLIDEYFDGQLEN